MRQWVWAARDKDGSLYLFELKPRKNKESGELKPNNANIWCTSFIELPKTMLPDIQWEDKEPTKVTGFTLSPSKKLK